MCPPPFGKILEGGLGMYTSNNPFREPEGFRDFDYSRGMWYV